MGSRKEKLTKYLLIAAILLVGAFVRFYRIADTPMTAGFDPAFYGVDALYILQGETPVYLASNFGREALYSYFVAAVVAAVGANDFALHLTTTLCGMVTIVATWRVATELLYDHRSRHVRRYAPILSAAIVATSYWHLAWSRFGVRAVLAPTFICLVIFFLVCGLRRNNRMMIVAAGVLGGLSIHTYQVAQLLPLVVVIILVRMFRPKHNRISDLLISLLASIIIVAPLAWYGFNNPDIFNSRVRDVALYSEEGTQSMDDTIQERVRDAAAFFVLDGEVNDKFSTIGQLAVNRFFQAGLLAGLVVLLRNPLKKYSFILIAWGVVMLLPAILADGEPVSKRAIGMIPAVAIVSAVGWVTLLSWNRHVWRVGSVVLAMVVLLTAFSSVTEYVAFANDPATQRLFDPQVSEMAHFIGRLPENELVYLSAEDPQHPNMLFHTSLKSSTSSGVRAYNGWHCLVFPEVTQQPTTYALSEPNSLPLLEKLYANGETIIQNYPDQYGFIDYYHAFRLDEGERAQIAAQSQTEAIWGEHLLLHGFDLEPKIYAAGETVDLTLYLSTLAQNATRYTVFVHILDPVALENGEPPLRGQRDIEPCNSYYVTSVWRVGEVVRDRYQVVIDPETAPGTYQISMGFYSWQDGVRLPVNGRDSLILQEIEVR